ncbi:hypothetical protein EIMP300_65890 [Escherichia coli]|uniref:Head completion/stabilization protein n=1 Tax=Escherichia coli TaxID=562 RepID=A0A8S0FYM0_ECOLX|nr:hypothetical protein EIMP300_65890 [Escherichia coli]
MSMVARTNPGPAEDDITDTDDGDTRISAGAFWPDIVLRELRLAVRLPGRVTTSRLLHTATGAIAHVTRELEAWQQEQQAAGYQTLADVPAPVINGISVRKRQSLALAQCCLYRHTRPDSGALPRCGHNGQGRPPGGRTGYTDIGFVARCELGHL